MKKYLFLLFLLPNFLAKAAPRYEFTPLALKTYRAILALRLNDATAGVVQMRLTDPENLMSYYLEDYIETIIIFLDENKNTFNKYAANKDKRLEKLATGPQSSPYYLYTQAEINLRWAIARAKFTESLTSMDNVTSFKEVTSAYKMLVKNDKKFPDFIANKKTISTLRAVFGSVPPEYRWASNLISGIDGDIEKGRKELEEVVNYGKNNKFVFDDETHLVYAFTLLYLGNQGEEAWSVMKNSHLKPEKSVLAALAMANVGMKTGHAAEVVQILQNAPKSKSYYSVPLINYYLGVAKLNLLEEDANQYLNTFVKNAKGKTAVKEAYQKLAWYQLIHGNEAGYWANIKLCKTQGGTVTDGDKAALREAKSGQKPEPNLLKARLLFDGGQYERALQSLQQKSSSDFAQKAHQLEYSYRLGRIYHKLNRNAEAANLYQQTINEGKDEDYMFACNSAFQLGSIYEQKGELQQAKNYYNLCLSMHPSDYVAGLHQKAKAGLNRIGM